MNFYFIVKDGVIVNIVQRNLTPQSTKEFHFYKADNVDLGLYSMLIKNQESVTLQEILNLKR